MDRVFAVHAGSRGFGYHRRHMSKRFSDPIDKGIRTQCALSWKIVVSEWRSVIAVSLSVGGVVRLVEPAKLYMCTQTHYKHNEDGRTAPVVRAHGSVPLSHSGNVVMRIGLLTLLNNCHDSLLTLSLPYTPAHPLTPPSLFPLQNFFIQILYHYINVHMSTT